MTQEKRQFRGKNKTQPKEFKPNSIPKVGRPPEFERIRFEYSSMEQCSAHLHIPKSVLKMAKKNGCPAFRGSDIKTLELIRWCFDRENSEDGESGISWGEELNKEKAKRERIRRKKEEGQTFDAGDVTFAINEGTSKFFAAAEKAADVDFPAMLVGLDAISIQKKIREEIEKWKDILRESFKIISKQPSENLQSET